MVKTEVSIGELFKAISDIENISFLHDKEIFQKNKILIKDEKCNYQDVVGLITKQDKIRTIKFSDNSELKCAEKHLICINPQTQKCKFVSELKINNKIKTAMDTEIAVLSNVVSNEIDTVYDLEIKTNNHLYQTSNGIVHHNTELAKQLSSNLGIKLQRFDMSEYQEKHTVARLIGAPPGYVGYEEGGLLVDTIRNTPNCVLLFDEIEKAHPDIFNTFLQIMDSAEITDTQGRKADFKNTVIIMTSNAGAKDVTKQGIGFGAETVNNFAMGEAVKNTFAPEFRNRLDAIVEFNHLSREVSVNIVKKEIKEFKDMLKEKNVTMTVKKNVINFLIDKGYSQEFGARNIARTVDKYIKDLFIEEVLYGDLSKGGKVTLSIKDDEINMTIHEK